MAISTMQLRQAIARFGLSTMMTALTRIQVNLVDSAVASNSSIQIIYIWTR